MNRKMKILDSEGAKDTNNRWWYRLKIKRWSCPVVLHRCEIVNEVVLLSGTKTILVDMERSRFTNHNHLCGWVWGAVSTHSREAESCPCPQVCLFLHMIRPVRERVNLSYVLMVIMHSCYGRLKYHHESSKSLPLEQNLWHIIASGSNIFDSFQCYYLVGWRTFLCSSFCVLRSTRLPSNAYSPLLFKENYRAI